MPEPERDQQEREPEEPRVSPETIEDLEVAEPDAEDVRGGVGTTGQIMKANCPMES